MAARISGYMAATRMLDSGTITEGLVCEIKRAYTGRGFWYVRCKQLDCDAFLPVSVLEASGLGSRRGSTLVCDIEYLGLLSQVVRIHTIH
jgi:hypothetical protein